MQAEKRSTRLARRAALTAGVLVLFLAGRSIPLPGVDLEALPSRSPLSLVSVLGLGLTPWITGWLSVEVVSLLSWPLRRWRRGGWAGRLNLERVSMLAGVFCALWQAKGIASVLEGWSGSAGRALVPHPGWTFWLPCVVTLTAGSASLFWLATVVTRWGLGNGFSLLLLTELCLQLWREMTTADLGYLPPIALSLDQILLQGSAALALALGLGLYLLALERRGAGVGGTSSERKGPKGARASRWGVAFPQSLLAVPVAGGVLQVLFGRGSWRGLLGGFAFAARFAAGGVWVWIAAQTVLVALLAWLFHRLFSGPKRLAAELPLPKEGWNRLASELGRRTRASTLFLVAGSAGLVAWSVLHPGPWSTLFNIVPLGLLITVPWDLASQWSFTRAHGAVASLCSLNNVHLGPELVARLQGAGIPATLQGFRHRALFFSYLPLVQIGVLVPEGRLEEARAVLQGVAVRVA